MANPEIETICRLVKKIIETIEKINPINSWNTKIKIDKTITPIAIKIPVEPKDWAKLTIFFHSKLSINCCGEAFT